MAEHASLTDPNLHEPKGVAAADVNTVYVADGAGSGDWLPLTYMVSGVIADISTAETVYIPIPYAGTVTKVTGVLAGVITLADSIVTVKNSAGVSMGTLTIANAGSGAGTVDILSPASNNTVSANSYITVETDGASTGAQKWWFIVTIERS